ncbi:MAG TPA: hypothetical protein VKZ50_19305 [bacterium]|nr:hypothetical protein [bacterium]
MRLAGWRLAVATVAVATAVGLSGWLSAASAHEQRAVGSVHMTVGWVDEPTYVGYRNAVQLFLADATNKPVLDVGDGLKVQVIFGNQKTGMLPLDPSFDPDTGLGTRGEFRASIIPTRPGNYTFHFVGAVGKQHIDQSFTTSPTTFDPVEDATGVEFPAKEPSTSEIAGLVERLGSRVDASAAAARDAAASAAQARSLGIGGVVAGLVGIVIGVGAARRRTTR